MAGNGARIQYCSGVAVGDALLVAVPQGVAVNASTGAPAARERAVAQRLVGMAEAGVPVQRRAPTVGNQVATRRRRRIARRRRWRTRRRIGPTRRADGRVGVEAVCCNSDSRRAVSVAVCNAATTGGCRVDLRTAYSKNWRPPAAPGSRCDLEPCIQQQENKRGEHKDYQITTCVKLENGAHRHVNCMRNVVIPSYSADTAVQ